MYQYCTKYKDLIIINVSFEYSRDRVGLAGFEIKNEV